MFRVFDCCCARRVSRCFALFRKSHAYTRIHVCFACVSRVYCCFARRVFRTCFAAVSHTVSRKGVTTVCGIRGSFEAVSRVSHSRTACVSRGLRIVAASRGRRGCFLLSQLSYLAGVSRERTLLTGTK
eukprot:7249240-Prymnesium_polylepis.1